MLDHLDYSIVDVFASGPFKGNPAAVFVLQEKLSDALMQDIATRMNLPETAFVLRREDENPLLRWFTPSFEMKLCGHATLAAGHIYLTKILPLRSDVTFATQYAGSLRVEKSGKLYTMDFPLQPGTSVFLETVYPGTLTALSNTLPVAAYQAPRDLMLVYNDAATVWSMRPDFTKLKDFSRRPIIVTAPSENPDHDFVSRYFDAKDAITEDPVTGSAHCTLAPYWCQRLSKNKLKARQISARGGELFLEISGDRVLITGNVNDFFEGALTPGFFKPDAQPL